MRSTVSVVLLALGCLPRGPTPAGHQVLPTRASAGAQLLAPAAGMPRRLLVWQARPDGDGSDLALSDLSMGGAGPLRPLAERIDLDRSRVCTGRPPYTCAFSTDRQGRVLVQRSAGPHMNGLGVDQAPLIQVDLATGQTEELGLVRGVERSPSGDRLVVSIGQGFQLRVRSADGSWTMLEDVSNHFFQGEDLFYLLSPPPPDRDHPEPMPSMLAVLRADGVTEHVSEPVEQVIIRDRGDTPMLILSRRVAGSMDRRYTVLDPATLVESPLLTASALTEFDVSPDGRHLVLATYSEDSSNPARRFAFIDRRTGAMESSSFDAPLPLGSFQRSIPVYWRPGHEEAWIVGGDRIFIWRPGSAIAEMQTGLVYFPPSVDDPEPSLFTRDGAHFFVFGPEGDNLANQFLPVYLASADDPLGPRLRLNAPGTALDEVRSLPDGRLLIRTWTTLPQRGDIHLVDPVLGTIRAVASAGSVTTIGAGRALALLRFVERAGTGDLNLLDLATGAHTLLGENVSFTALDPVGDPLAPGALLAFVVRNRLASPYDGLWLGVLP